MLHQVSELDVLDTYQRHSGERPADVGFIPDARLWGVTIYHYKDGTVEQEMKIQA